MPELFIDQQLSFEKVSQSGKVGESSELWPQEVLDMFFREHPYLADAEADPVFKETSDERGYAVGVLIVRKKPTVTPKDVETSSVIKEIKFPFVIKDKEVSPFDVFIVGETFHPATERNIQEAILRPDMFDIVTTMPGDISLVNQLYPPYRSRYGFGTSFEGGAGGKFASVKDIMKVSVIDQIAPFISQSDLDRVQHLLEKDATVRQVALQHAPLRATLGKLAAVRDVSAESMIAARRSAIQPDVIQFTKESGRIKVRRANSQMYAPQVEFMTMKQAAEALPADLKNRIMSDGGATISADPVVRSSFKESTAVRIKTSGMYRIKCSDPEKMGREKLARVFTSVVDFDMTTLPVRLAVFSDSDWCLQDQMAGISTPEEDAPDFIKDGHAKVKDYMPVTVDDMHESTGSSKGREYNSLPRDTAMPKLGMVMFVGDGVATLPVTLKSARIDKGVVTLHGTSAMEQSINLVPTEGITKIEKIGATTYALPHNLKVIHLRLPVSCASDPAEYVKVASLRGTVEIISDGQSYKFRGPTSLLKLGAEQTDFLGYDDALFLASSLGIEPRFAGAMLQKAAKVGAVAIPGIRPIITEQDKISEAMQLVAPIVAQLEPVRALLLKQAAVLPGEDTVDKVLSLNFITPENVSIFIKNIPVFQATASELGKLLVGVRIGLESVPESAVQRSMQSLQGVIEALQELQFNQPQR